MEKIDISSNVITDEHLVVLLGLLNRRSYREIADEIGKSAGYVQIRVTDLERMGHILPNDTKKARSRTISSKGHALLKKNNLGWVNNDLHHD
jgi:transposase